MSLIDAGGATEELGGDGALRDGALLGADHRGHRARLAAPGPRAHPRAEAPALPRRASCGSRPVARSRPPREEPLTEPCRAQGFVVLKGVVPRELTQRAKTALREFDDSTAKNLSEGRHPIGPSIIGASAEITDLINASPFTPVLKSLIGEFDPPTATQVAVLPVTDGEESAGFNGAGYPEEGFPFYNAGIHMVTPCSPCFFSCSCSCSCCSSCSSR